MTFLTILAIFSIDPVIRAYVKSPTRQDKTRLASMLVLILISAYTIYATKGLWSYILAADPTVITVLFPLSMYVLAFSALMSLAIWKKKGLSELKGIWESGLFYQGLLGLFWGFLFMIIGAMRGELILGLILGLAFGLFGAITDGCFVELKEEPIKI